MAVARKVVEHPLNLPVGIVERIVLKIGQRRVNYLGLNQFLDYQS